MRSFVKRREIVARRIRHAVYVAGMIVVSLLDTGAAGAASLSDRGVAGERTAPGATPRLQALAHRGNTRAQTMLGFAYETGRGVPQNYGLALEWYERAAISGNATAQYLLGLLYDKGLGVPVNKIIAHKWLILAAAGAPNREREYFVRIRDAVASSMSTDEIAESQALAYQSTATRRR